MADPRLPGGTALRPVSPMQRYLEDLIEAAPEIRGVDGETVKAAACQLAFIGNVIAGAITHGPVTGTFRYLTMGADPRTKQAVMVERVFTADHVLYVDRVVGEGPRVEVISPTVQ